MALSTTRLAQVSDRTGTLVESDADADPVVQFRRWFDEAEAAGVRAPNAMAIATATPEGVPSVRMVLLKGHGEDGFVFFTGYVSRKAGELDANPCAALLFYWDPLGRQVRVEGTVERVGTEESDEYFASRPRGAQLAAAASRQSSVLRDRDEIDARVAELEHEHVGKDVPRPEHWGGYRLRPDAYEFWQHRENRAHDRLRYRRDGDGWTIERLSP
jgi:pyridoxamine 5'-phosphate oxidase